MTYALSDGARKHVVRPAPGSCFWVGRYIRCYYASRYVFIWEYCTAPFCCFNRPWVRSNLIPVNERARGPRTIGQLPVAVMPIASRHETASIPIAAILV